MPFIVGGTVDEGAGFEINPIAAGGSKIVGEPTTEITGLADIDDLGETVAN